MKTIKIIKTGVVLTVFCVALIDASKGNYPYGYSGNNNIDESYSYSLERPSVKTDTGNMTVSEKIEDIAKQIEEGDVDATLLQNAINISNQLSSYHEGNSEMSELDEQIVGHADEVVEMIQGGILGTVEASKASESVLELYDLVNGYNNVTDPDEKTVNPEEEIPEEPSTNERINIGVLNNIAQQIEEGDFDEQALQYAMDFVDQLSSYHEDKPERIALDIRIVKQAEEVVEMIQGLFQGTVGKNEASKSVQVLSDLINSYANIPEVVRETPEEDSYEEVDNFGNIRGLPGMISEAIKSFLPSILQPLFVRSGLYELFQNYPDGSSISLTDEEREDYQNALQDLQTPDDVVGFFRGEYDDTSRVSYTNTLMNIVFGDPAGLFLNRKGNCHSHARFAQEALENMPDGVEPYETRLIHNTYRGHNDSHVMLAYRDPETGKWGFMSPYGNYSPEMIEERGINPVNPEEIVAFISLFYDPENYAYSDGPTFQNTIERITFLDNSNSYVFDEAYIINGDGTYERETLFQRLLGYLFS